ncbi:MAG: ATP-binding protein, partial [Clostridia bacterium]|nr:ATP-binding protein [Clostridia bacterium]
VIITIAAMFISKKVKKKKNLLGIEEQDGIAYDFTIDNEVSQAIKASEEAMSFCAEKSLPENTVNAVGVTVEELCHNIATYARSSSNKTVDVCVRIFDDKVNIRLRDNGVEFDPTDYIDTGGKRITGLTLVRKLSSSITYNRVLGFNVTNVTINY